MNQLHGAILTKNGFKNGYITVNEQESSTLHVYNKSSTHETQLIIP